MSIDLDTYEIGLIRKSETDIIAILSQYRYPVPDYMVLNNASLFTANPNSLDMPVNKTNFIKLLVSNHGKTLSDARGSELFEGREKIARFNLPNSYKTFWYDKEQDELELILMLLNNKHRKISTHHKTYSWKMSAKEVSEEFANYQIMIESGFRTSAQIQLEIMMDLVENELPENTSLNEEPVYLNKRGLRLEKFS